MKSEYSKWMDEWYAKNGSGYGRCREATREMVKAFPELTIVRGHVEALDWGRRGHWWCVTTTGDIVDPTATQFPAIMSYEPWEPGDEIRTGTCMECGAPIWAPVTSLDGPPRRSLFCSTQCEIVCGEALNGKGNRL